MKDGKFAYKKEALLRLQKSLKVLQEAGEKSVEMTGAHLIQNTTGQFQFDIGKQNLVI